MADTPHALIVDDELPICQNGVKILSKLDIEVDYALSGYEALRLMATKAFAVVVTDLKMKGMGGMELLSRVRDAYPHTRVIVITGYASVASAVEVMKTGAFDYLPKPFTPQELRTVVQQALADIESETENRKLKRALEMAPTVTHQLVGDSPKMQKVVSMIQKVAPTDATVLICGESGTGKELVARAVHANSQRHEGVFFAVDCGTLSGNLLESELFGYRRGAFTGADRNKAGVFERAHKGTVFLDEISNTSREVQGKLLRFIEAREFLPLGATRPRKVDVRLIFATNEDLGDMVSEARFREDFYYRIFVYPIMLPPLRDRRSDILPIGYHFLNLFNQQMNKAVAGFSDEAARRLSRFDWPGNVRQLRNLIERAVILCEQDTIQAKDLQLPDDAEDLEAITEQVPKTNDELKQLKKEIRQKAVAGVEKKFIINALQNSGWNVTQAAKKAGMQRSNFQNLMKKHAVRRPS